MSKNADLKTNEEVAEKAVVKEKPEEQPQAEEPDTEAETKPADKIKADTPMEGS